MDQEGRGPGQEDEPTLDLSTGKPRAGGVKRSDRYRVGAELGKGGMATVVEAEDTILGRIVALKIMRPSVAKDGSMRERFSRESRILAGLSHPGLVAVYDAGVLSEDEPFIAMERVRGRTLAELIRSRTGREVGDRHRLLRLIDIFERVCQALAYVHAHGIIHRDIKPTNIMVDDEFGIVFVMDWGLAKEIESPRHAEEELTQAGDIMGTPGYMSPEQARGLAEAGDRHTDVFALGVILYEILTGQKPFQGAGLKDLLEEIVHHEPEPPRAINRIAGRELSAICMKALAKDPRRRYPSARELADDIRRYREFLPVSAIRPRLVDRLGNWARRHRVATATVVTLLLVALAGAAYFGQRAFHRQQTVAWAMSLVEETQRDIEVIDREIAETTIRLAAAGDEAERTFLQQVTLPELRAQKEVMEFDLRGRLLAILGFIYPSSDERVQSLLKEQVLRAIAYRMSAGEYATVEALIGSALSAQERLDIYGLTDEEAAGMRLMLERARSELRRGIDAGQD